MESNPSAIVGGRTPQHVKALTLHPCQIKVFAAGSYEFADACAHGSREVVEYRVKSPHGTRVPIVSARCETKTLRFLLARSTEFPLYFCRPTGTQPVEFPRFGVNTNPSCAMRIHVGLHHNIFQNKTSTQFTRIIRPSKRRNNFFHQTGTVLPVSHRRPAGMACHPPVA